MATDRDRVAEGSAEAELVAVAVCALAHLHPLCPEQAPGPLTVSYREVGASKKQGNPRSQAELTTLLLCLSPSPLLLRALSRPASLQYRGWRCFMGSCLSRGQTLYKAPFLFFPSYSVRKARASLSLLS